MHDDMRPVQTRLAPAELEALESFRGQQRPIPSISEALRNLVIAGLSKHMKSNGSHECAA
jgi:hypothetical protein